MLRSNHPSRVGFLGRAASVSIPGASTVFKFAFGARLGRELRLPPQTPPRGHARTCAGGAWGLHLVGAVGSGRVDSWASAKRSLRSCGRATSTARRRTSDADVAQVLIPCDSQVATSEKPRACIAVTTRSTRPHSQRRPRGRRRGPARPTTWSRRSALQELLGADEVTARVGSIVATFGVKRARERIPRVFSGSRSESLRYRSMPRGDEGTGRRSSPGARPFARSRRRRPCKVRLISASVGSS